MNLKNFSRPSANLLLVYLSAGIGVKFLFAAYQAFIQGSALPAGIGATRTVFIPNSSEVDAIGL